MYAAEKQTLRPGWFELKPCCKLNNCRQRWSVGRIMFARLNRLVPGNQVEGKTEPRRDDRLHVNFNTSRMEKDPFPDP